MGRNPRIEFEGAVYHVMSRGNRQEAIFLDDHDNRIFLDTLAEACGRAGWKVHAFVLMGNHYHLLIETPRREKVSGEKVSVLSCDLFDWSADGSGVELCAWEEIRELNLKGRFIM